MKKIAEFCENLKQKKSFQYTVIAIILISSLTIGIKTYSLNPATYNLILIADIAVTVFFLIEWPLHKLITWVILELWVQKFLII